MYARLTYARLQRPGLAGHAPQACGLYIRQLVLGAGAPAHQRATWAQHLGYRCQKSACTASVCCSIVFGCICVALRAYGGGRLCFGRGCSHGIGRPSSCSTVARASTCLTLAMSTKCGSFLNELALGDCSDASSPCSRNDLRIVSWPYARHPAWVPAVFQCTSFAGPAASPDGVGNSKA